MGATEGLFFSESDNLPPVLLRDSFFIPFLVHALAHQPQGWPSSIGGQWSGPEPFQAPLFFVFSMGATEGLFFSESDNLPPVLLRDSFFIPFLVHALAHQPQGWPSSIGGQWSGPELFQAPLFFAFSMGATEGLFFSESDNLPPVLLRDSIRSILSESVFVASAL